MLTSPLLDRGHYKHLLCLFFAVLLALSFTFVLGNRCRQTYLLLKVESLQQNHLQVFFDTGAGIEKSFNQAQGIPAGDFIKSVRISVPDKAIYALRIDPDTNIRIVEISLVDSHNALITRLDTTNLIALNDIDDLQKTDEGVLVITKGVDPQLGLVLSSPLPNDYGFNVLFALVLFFIFYCILWFASLLLRIIQGDLTSGAEGLVIKQGRSSAYGLHRIIIVLGVVAIAGGAFIWICEGRISLGDDHGEHDLVRYKNEIFAKSVTFERQPDGLSLSAMIYKVREREGKHPAILLLHGNYPQASMFPLYRVMGAELARMGYVVLSMDLSGYGRSADPFAAGGREGFNLDWDAASGLQFLLQQSDVDGDRIHVTGHSMGADPAISVGSLTGVVRSIALIGPPRRVFERFNYPPDLDFFWNWALHVRKTVYKKEQFPDWFSKELWQQQILDRDMVHFLPYFSQWSHKPVLFLDGEREIGPDRRFLQWYYCRTSWPKQYVTLNKANHDCNVMIRNGQIYYDPAVMDQTVDVLDQWFKRAEKKQPQLSDLILNLLRRLFAVEMLKGC